MDYASTIFYIIVVICSLVVHEMSHGFMALYLGDDTAKRAGRLTLNPLKHLDPFGSVILPLLLAISHLPVFGWAKPTPYDPRFLKHPKRDAGLIHLAGPASNFLLALIFAILFRILIAFTESSVQLDQVLQLFIMIIVTNLVLGFFNLLPIPPLDGSGVLFALLPPSFNGLETFLRQFGMIILLFVFMSGASFLSPLIYNAAHFLIDFGR